MHFDNHTVALSTAISNLDNLYRDYLRSLAIMETNTSMVIQHKVSPEEAEPIMSVFYQETLETISDLSMEMIAIAELLYKYHVYEGVIYDGSLGSIHTQPEGSEDGGEGYPEGGQGASSEGQGEI